MDELRTTRSASSPREVPARPTAPTQQWAMDFVSDHLASGRRFRTLTVVDEFSRWCPGILVETSISGEQVARFLDELAATKGLPERIVVDNGPEFISNALDKWAYERGVKLHFIKPGTPTQNAFIESFNGSFRNECLNANWFDSLAHARQIIEASRRGASTTTPIDPTAPLAISRRSSTNANTQPPIGRKRWPSKRGQVTRRTVTVLRRTRQRTGYLHSTADFLGGFSD